MNTEIKKNACEVCNEKPARATIYEQKSKDKEHKHPILHYSCLNHVLDLSNKIEHRFVIPSTIFYHNDNEISTLELKPKIVVVVGFSIIFVAILLVMILFDIFFGSSFANTTEYCARYGFLDPPNCWQ